MFKWLQEEEMDILLLINSNDYNDWIDKRVEIMHICYKHDTLKNKLKAIGTTITRCGLASHYLPYAPEYDFNSEIQVQTLRVHCWPGALKEIVKLKYFWYFWCIEKGE